MKTERRGARAGVLILAGLLAGGPGNVEAAPACLGEAIEATAEAAVDARTLRLADGSELRLAGIEPFSILLENAGEAESRLARRLSDLVAGATVTAAVLSSRPDRYGRLPALVAVGETLAQEVLAAEGLAVAFANAEALPCFAEILAAEGEAREAGRGFWHNFRMPEAKPDALAERIDGFAIFEGTVLSVGARPATTYIDFGRRWSEDVTIEIAARHRELFGGEIALERLAGSRIRARGFLTEKSGPMLTVRSPAELEILVPRPGSDRIAP